MAKQKYIPPPAIEPEWESDIYEAAKVTFRRLYHLSNGAKFPEGEIESPAAVGIINAEMIRLVAKLTEHWY